MKDVKKEFRWFSITEYEKEAEYLRRRHKEGWKFKNVTYPGIYIFEKCEPQDVIYQLDYNPDGIKNQGEYVQMFEDCGWEYLKEFAVRIRGAEEVAIIGPASPGIGKINDVYRKVLYLKTEKYDTLIKMKNKLEQYIEVNPGFNPMRIQFDFNPMHIS